MSHPKPIHPTHPRPVPAAAGRLTSPLAWALLSALAGACSNAAGGTRSAPHELEVTAADFHFRAPQTVPAGLTRIRLMNAGPEFHHVQLVRLEQGHTLAQFLEALRPGEPAPPWATYVGGPEVPMPGQESEVTLTLSAGQYAMICVVSAGDHIPHVAKGMALSLTVTPNPAPSAPEPEADTRIVLAEYSFTIVPELRAGRHTIRVENAGTQPHHVEFVKLDPGKNLEDMRAWLRRPEGKPPAEPVGGTTAIAPGVVNYLMLDLAPADYGLICFVPDAHDGRSHANHGMVHTIRVR